MHRARRLRRALLAAGGTFLLLALFALPGARPSRAIIISGSFLRSAGEMRSLGFLLQNEAVRREISSVSEGMSLWKVQTRTTPVEGPSTCLGISTWDGPPEKVKHSFVFASRRGQSTRAYALDYLSCRQTEDQYDIQLDRQGFQSDFQLRGSPMLTGPVPLRVLSLALRDESVTSDLTKVLLDRSIAYCRVADTDEVGPSGHSIYHFTAADGVPGEPETTEVISYAAEYDEVLDMAVFTRIAE